MLTIKEKIKFFREYLINNSNYMKEELYLYFFEYENGSLKFLEKLDSDIEIQNKVDLLVSKMIMHEDDDELFNINNYNNLEIKSFYSYKIVEEYFNSVYNVNDEKEIWWNKVKEHSSKYGFCPDVKEYKVCPGKYCGHVGDLCELIRASITGKIVTPDIYEILKLLDKASIEKRIKLFSIVCLTQH